MPIRKSIPMPYADRYGLQQADQAIKKDVVRALVELITNSDDSYRRLEDRSIKTTGPILIEVRRRHQNSEIRVCDNAEGMDENALDKAFVYGEDASGFSNGKPVRGYFGRGLKDAILGMGEGGVTSIVGNSVHDAWLGIKQGRPYYEAQEKTVAGHDLRQSLEIPTGNGTSVKITVTRDGIRMPQSDNLRRQLCLYYSLRNLMSNPHRSVVLRELDQRGSIRKQVSLDYKFPKGLQLLLNEERDIPGFPASFRLVLWRSEIELDTPGEVGPYAQGGFLIEGKHAIFDNTLLKYGDNIHARRFTGRISCPYIDELLKQDELLIKATRDGLDWEHPFNKALKKAVEAIVEPYIEQEAQRALARERRARSAKLQQKFDSLVRQLNEIARLELEEVGKEKVDIKTPEVPETGFGFVPWYAHIVSEREITLLLRTEVRIVPAGTQVTIASDNAEVVVLTPEVTIEERSDFSWVGEAKVRLEGRQVGNEAVITAEANGLKAEALVTVVARKEPPPPPPPRPPKGGLFNELIPTDVPNPPQRVWYERESKNIVYATRHPSVSPYLGPGDDGADKPQGQVMLAELVIEAAFTEFIREGIKKNSPKYGLVPGNEAEGIQAHYRRLRNQYAGPIHRALVDPEFRKEFK